MAAELPDWADVVAHLRDQEPVVAVLRNAVAAGRPVVQPRCGVGGHAAMLGLLDELERAGAGILSVTIDSHTRLRQFDMARRLLTERPTGLNGYPLVAHGWERGRELAAAVSVPLEIRHGSPDARALFAVALASGITAFEGGGIGYNLPYSKDVPLRESLSAWRAVDRVCGELGRAGVIIDRELFGTLTAVLVPPSISIAVTLLEAVAATREGVRCVSPAYPQGGETHQDIAALRTIRALSTRYLGADVEVFPVLHEFMGAFPKTKEYADALILHGGLVARLGGASKVISKTSQEAYGLPDTEANSQGVRTTRIGASDLFDFVAVDEDRVAEEAHWIEREVIELVEPVLAATDLESAIVAAFAEGTLDIPFSASVHAQSAVIPRRDSSGAIRYADSGRLPFSPATRRRNDERLDALAANRLVDAVTADIFYFLGKEALLPVRSS